MSWFVRALLELLVDMAEAAEGAWVEFRPCGFVLEDIMNIPPSEEVITQPAPKLLKVLINPQMVSEIVEWKHSGVGPRCTLIIMANGEHRHVIGSYSEVREKLDK